MDLQEKLDKRLNARKKAAVKMLKGNQLVLKNFKDNAEIDANNYMRGSTHSWNTPR